MAEEAGGGKGVEVMPPVTDDDLAAIRSEQAWSLSPRGDDLTFVDERFAALRISRVALTSPHYYLPDLRPLLSLRDSLAALVLPSVRVFNLDLTAFPHLADLRIEWSRGAESVYGCTGLKRLDFYRYPEPDLTPLVALTALQDLSVTVSTRVRSLTGAAELKRLVRLNLYACPNLTEGLEELRQLPHLTKLTVEQCKRFGPIDPVAAIPTLESLHFESTSYALPTLRPLAGHPRLRFLALGAMKVEDGDMSPLLEIPNLARVAHQNYKHYSHTREELNAIFRARHPKSTV